MAEWLPVLPVKDLQRRRKTLVQVGDDPVALFWVKDRIFALYDTCMHEERSLSKGAILGGRVVCPGHQWAFELETGYVEDQARCQPTYDARIEGDTVYVWSRPRGAGAAGESATTGEQQPEAVRG